MDMEIQIIELPEVAIIGKEGLCTEENNIAQDLWQEANSHFDEVAALGMRNSDGTYVGFWGAMSDENRTFQPWTNHFSRGLYLAGLETYADAVAPEGWTKWIMPSRKYLVVNVEPDRYGEIFNEVINMIIPEKGLKLSGAVCDYTEPATGENKLFFPVESSASKRQLGIGRKYGIQKMSKYEPLWKWIKENRTDSFILSYAEIEKILGFPIDHSFLTFKKELMEYGFSVGKISMKNQTVSFEKD